MKASQNNNNKSKNIPKKEVKKEDRKSKEAKKENGNKKGQNKNEVKKIDKSVGNSNNKNIKKQNIIDSSKDYIKQITYYYEFKMEYKSFINNFPKGNSPPKLPVKEQHYYIISQNWLKTWKNFVNYKDFKKLVSERLKLDNDIVIDYMKNHKENQPPGKIDEEFKGKTALDIINGLRNGLSKSFKFVSDKFYNLFPHNKEIKIKMSIIGKGKNYKFVISPLDIKNNKDKKNIVIDYAPNLDGTQNKKTYYLVKNKNQDELLDMPLEQLRDPNNKDIEFKLQIKKENNNINTNNNNNIEIPKVNPQEFKKALPKQEIEGVKEVTYVGLTTPEEIVKLNNKGVGLNNIGSTCYMNSTLQCLSNIGPLTKYFLKKEHRINFEKEKNNKNIKNKLSPYYADVIYHLWDEKYKSSGFSPYEFKKKLGELNPLFEGFKAGDAKDLYNYLIMQMHSELNKEKKKNDNIIDINQNINQTNEEEMKGLFYKNFTENYNSRISNIFYGSTKSMMTCLNCGIITYNFEIYFFLIFPLEKVRQFKSLFYGMNVNSVNILECLTEAQSPAILEGYCNHCRRNSNLQQKTCLYTVPNYLVIILNRGKGNEFNVGYNIDEFIDLSNFVEFKLDIAQFFLNGVIVHLGPSGESGHFIAYCCSPIDNKWYCYNDSIVTLCNQENIVGQIASKGIPYLLFYRKCKNDKKEK